MLFITTSEESRSTKHLSQEAYAFAAGKIELTITRKSVALIVIVGCESCVGMGSILHVFVVSVVSVRDKNGVFVD
jgi:hypothetical protein